MGDCTDEYCKTCDTKMEFDGDSYYCPKCIKKPGVDAFDIDKQIDILEETVRDNQEMGLYDEEYRPTIGAEKLAEDHWKYMEEVYRLAMPYTSAEWEIDNLIDLLEFTYKSSFIHGFKHSQEGD